ncbi:DNA glycosylase AlkZ-like family protein, partial [Pseudomonadota bacterium]
AQVRSEGPLQAKDIEAHRGNAGGMWEWGPVKQALEMLFMEGKLLVTRRDSFQKVFDLAERVVPDGTNVSEPTKNEYAHWLIDRHLAAHGLGRHAEFSYLRRGMGPAVKAALAEKIEAGDVVPLRIRRNGAMFYANKGYESLLARRLTRNRVRFLSPFDNLIIQRKRVEQLFDFDYQLECYVPEEKRRYGYFCLPVLWRGRLVARMDAKADRKHRVFRVHSLVTEPVIRDIEEFARQAGTELRRLTAFHDCDRISIGLASPPALRGLLRQAAACA